MLVHLQRHNEIKRSRGASVSVDARTFEEIAKPCFSYKYVNSSLTVSLSAPVNFHFTSVARSPPIIVLFLNQRSVRCAYCGYKQCQERSPVG